MKITGTITWIEQGSGTWGLVGDDGTTYELYGSKATALETEGETEGQRVAVTGTIREDVMTLAMIGPVLEVEDYTVEP
jgi:hypothetical protein